MDRAALDVALELRLPCRGWCPLGRRAEDGPLPARYPLRETPSPEYPQRTEWNIRDADATLVLHGGRLDRGTALTSRLAGRLGKPLLLMDLSRRPRAGDLRRWLEEQGVRALNVAGPRESRAPGIHTRARAFLRRALSER